MDDIPSKPAGTGTASPSSVIFKKRKNAAANNRRRQPSPARSPSPSRSDSSSGDDLPEGAPSKRQRLKQRRIAAAVTTSASTADTRSDELVAATISADRSALTTKLGESDATKQSTWTGERLGATKAPRDIQSPAASKAIGPARKATNVRTTTMTDFAPDVCKDYRQTGFCGYGDSCKFVHDRSDYKQGWQLDREWDNVTKGKTVLPGTVVARAGRGTTKEEEDDDEEGTVPEDIPFVCILCKRDYEAPIVTRCGHYLCEKCALQRYRRDPTCAACGAATGGTFNTAKRLQKLLDRARKRAAEHEERGAGADSEASDEEE